MLTPKQIEELEQAVKELQDDLALNTNDAITGSLIERFRRLANLSTILALLDERTKLREALEKFGEHRSHCSFYKTGQPTCDCGYSSAFHPTLGTERRVSASEF